MTSEPGVLPKETETLEYNLLLPQMKQLINKIGNGMRRMEAEIRNERLKDKSEWMEKAEEQTNEESRREEEVLEDIDIFVDCHSDDDENKNGRRGFEKSKS